MKSYNKLLVALTCVGLIATASNSFAANAALGGQVGINFSASTKVSVHYYDDANALNVQDYALASKHEAGTIVYLTTNQSNLLKSGEDYNGVKDAMKGDNVVASLVITGVDPNTHVGKNTTVLKDDVAGNSFTLL